MKTAEKRQGGVSLWERAALVSLLRQHPEYTPEQLAKEYNRTRHRGHTLTPAAVASVLTDLQRFLGGKVS